MALTRDKSRGAVQLLSRWYARFVANDPSRGWLRISSAHAICGRREFQPRFGVVVWSAPLRQGVSLLNSKRNFATKKDDASVEMREVKGDPNGKNI